MNKTLLVLATLTGGALIAVSGAASAGEKTLGQKTFKARKISPCKLPNPPKWCSGNYLHHKKEYKPKPYPDPDPGPLRGMDRLKNKAGQFRR